LKQCDWQLPNQTLSWPIITPEPLPARIMGILNTTPDSFSDGGAFYHIDSAVARARALIEEGAFIVDIGGESSRPGAEPVPAHIEMSRVVPVIESIRAFSDVLISVDTVKADVALAAINAGANIVNDISAGRHDAQMFEVVREHGVGMVLMHMRGAPKTMQTGDLSTDSIVKDVTQFLESRVSEALRVGVKEGQLALDPGLGFGKTFEQNFSLCRSLSKMKKFGRPIVFGMSRKSSLGVLVNKPPPERDAASLAADLWAVHNGASVVRVHNVQQTMDAFKVWQCFVSGD
jgi:dihydropteroate synthase